jgi:hypothetical protein
MINLGGANDNNIYSGISVGAIFPEIIPVGELYDFNHPARPIFLELTKKYPPVEGNNSIIKIFNTDKLGSDACVKLDENIKNISDEILELQKITPALTGYELATSKDINVNKLEILRRILLQYKMAFNKGECTDTLEQIKSEANAKILTKESAKSEKQVLEKNYKEQYLYIGVGSAILLVGLYIVTRSKK